MFNLTKLQFLLQLNIKTDNTLYNPTSKTIVVSIKRFEINFNIRILCNIELIFLFIHFHVLG